MTLADVCDAYIISSGLWSLVGLTGGYAVGRVHCWHKRKKHHCE